MLNALVIALTTSYLAWFIERHESRVVYPFDPTYTAVADMAEPRLRELRFETPDGESLIVWAGDAAEGRPTVLYLPGNAGTLATRTARFRAFLDRGYGIVAYAYRGSSGSSGHPDEASLTSDARAVAAALPTLVGSRPEPVLLYGESLGSALAIKLAADGFGDGVILQSPFTSIRDLVRAQYPQEDVAHLFREVWDSRAVMPGVRQPLLILHGTLDRLVPIAQGEDLLAAAASPRKTLVPVEGVGHNGLWTPEAAAAIFAFLEEF
jgi:fermentation-respiration switch protein FrsA (DUF1100 family)